jgi:hypothetical protein
MNRSGLPLIALAFVFGSGLLCLNAQQQPKLQYAEFPPTTGKHMVYVGEAHDGDTKHLYLLVPFKGRLHGCDAVELKSPKGDDARKNFDVLVPPGTVYEIELKGPDKYFGRILVDMPLPGGTGTATQAQIVGGYAKPWDGKGPKPSQ